MSWEFLELLSYVFSSPEILKLSRLSNLYNNNLDKKYIPVYNVAPVRRGLWVTSSLHQALVKPLLVLRQDMSLQGSYCQRLGRADI